MNSKPVSTDLLLLGHKCVAALQGPLFETVPDFWRMVYECGSQMVVMLTLTEEVNIKDEVRVAPACLRQA